jgi:hypothetical protein
MIEHFIRILNFKKLILLITIFSILLSGCTDNKKYLGTWECQENNDMLTLFKDGTFVFDSSDGNGFTNTYKVIDQKIHMNCIFYTEIFEIKGDILIDEDGYHWTKVN